MAKTSMKLKQQRTPKFSTRAYNRCKICGRPHGYLRKFGICPYMLQESFLQRSDTRSKESKLVKEDGKCLLQT